MEKIKLKNYIRYVDDIVIISKSKIELRNALPMIITKLAETEQTISKKKQK